MNKCVVCDCPVPERECFCSAFCRRQVEKLIEKVIQKMSDRDLMDIFSRFGLKIGNLKRRRKMIDYKI